MTPIRLWGDDDEGDGGDSGRDEDEDEDEESTPVPRSKRQVARYFFSVSFCVSLIVYLPRITHALLRKTTTAKPATVKTKSCKRYMGREQDNEDGSDSGASGPADSIMDSSTEEEADDEVDGMLGE